MMEVQQPSKINKLFYIAAMVTLMISFFFLTWFFYNWITPKADLRITDVEIKDEIGHVNHKHLMRGAPISFRVHICKITDIPVNASIDLFDGEKDYISIFSSVFFLEKGCSHAVMTGIIPVNAPLGDYNVRVTLHQRLNFLRQESAVHTVGGYMTVDVDHVNTND